MSTFELASFNQLFKRFEINVMLRFWHIVAISTFALLLLATAHVYASDETEDLIDIIDSNSKIIAVVEGKRSVSFRLPPNEIIQWSSAKGNLGAFLSNRHFFVVSTSTSGWQRLPLRPGESTNRVAVLSPNIALLIDGDRALGFSTPSNRFIETRLPFYDQLFSVKADKYVAVVIMSSKAFGFFPGASHFSEIRLGVQEVVKDVKITSSKVTIRTSHRILTFRAGNSNWSEHRL